MLKPLGQFICDKCGGVIQEPKVGVIEWLIDRQDHEAFGFKIVHHPTAFGAGSAGCYHYDDQLNGWMHLDDMIGAKGLVVMLSHIDHGPYHREKFDGPHVKDLREWAEMMRRMFLPYYEEARQYWDKAEKDGFFSGGVNEIYLYMPETSKEIIEEYGKTRV